MKIAVDDYPQAVFKIMQEEIDELQKENEELRQEIKDWENWAKNYF